METSNAIFFALRHSSPLHGGVADEVEGRGEDEGDEEGVEGDFFVRDVPEVALDDEAADDLPEEEDAHHEAGEDFEAVLEPGGEEDEEDAGEEDVAALLVGEGGRGV